MRASEVLGARVIDAQGREIGVVQDLRARREAAGASAAVRGRFLIVAVVVGGDGILARAAHGWGFAADRAQGPWLLRRLTKRAVERSLVVPSELVESWDPAQLRLKASRSALLSLKELERE
jgi:hypothetical protein